MQGYSYSIVSGIALITHLIIHWCQLFHWQSAKERADAFEFRRFLIYVYLFFIADFLWGIFDGLNYPRFLYIDTIFFFLAMALSVYGWMRVVVSYLDLKGLRRGCLLQWIGRGMLVFFILALVVNFFTGSFFNIDNHSVYSEGALCRLALILLVALSMLGSGLTLLKALRTEGARRRRYVMVLTFCITMMAAIILQLLNPFIPFFALGCFIGCCLLHVFVIEDEHDEMHQKELLARDYEAKLETERATAQAKSLFFSTVSHDIRTPLNAIIGYSELLKNGLEDKAEQEHAVDAIASSGHTLLDLINDVLDLSKLDAGKTVLEPKLTDFTRLASGVLQAFDVTVSANGVKLEEDFATMPLLFIDRHRIRQILFNLIGNAAKFTEHGKIVLSAKFEESPDRNGEKTGCLTFSVSDTGCGIPPEDQENILKPFVQAKNSGAAKGTGLGLSICQQLTKLMGGTITLKSTLGKGTTFTIALPNISFSDDDTAQADTSKLTISISPPDSKNLRILLVDDVPVNMRVIQAMLHRLNATDVVTAENGKKALEMLRNDPSINLVLTDMWMPVMNGEELIREIRSGEQWKDLAVYAVTADVEVQKTYKASGFTGVLLKPITLERLQNILG